MWVLPGLNLTLLLGQSTLAGQFASMAFGGLSQFSILSIGIVPFISSSYATQLIFNIKAVKNRKDLSGAYEKKVKDRWTNIIGVMIAAASSIGLAVSFPLTTAMSPLLAALILFAGALFAKFVLAEVITRLGLGEGMLWILSLGVLFSIRSVFMGLWAIAGSHALVFLYAGIMVVLALGAVWLFSRNKKLKVLAIREGEPPKKVVGKPEEKEEIVPPLFLRIRCGDNGVWLSLFSCKSDSSNDIGSVWSEGGCDRCYPHVCFWQLAFYSGDSAHYFYSGDVIKHGHL